MSSTAAKAPPQRLIGVIDGTNLKGVLDNLGKTTHINYRQLIIEIGRQIPAEAGRWRLERVVYVTAPPIQSHDLARYQRWRKFEQLIRGTERVELRLGRLEGARDRVYEKGVDILVAIELLAGAYQNRYDFAILISGDGDFADVARVVREAQKRIYNAFFEGRHSYELVGACNGFIDLHTIDWQRLYRAPRPPLTGPRP